MPDFGDTTVFSQSDAGNATGTMPSWNGAAAPSTIDDAGRALQGAAVREWNWRSFTLTAGGTADAKTLTYSVAPAAYYNGQRFAFIANTTNTTAVTLNVNSLGAKAVRKVFTGTPAALVSGDMVLGMRVEVAYNQAADAFDWVNQQPLAASPGTVGGTANAVTLTFSPPFAAYTNGMRIRWRATATNTGAMTINVDGLGAKNFQMDASGTLAATFSGAVQNGMFIEAEYNSAADVFVWLNQKPLIFYTNGNVQAPSYNIGSLSNCFISPDIGGYPGINFDTSDFIAYARALDVMLFNVAGSERFRITSSGFGYATSGASVTQSTNKVTSVTINAASGLITMNAASLSNGASARFQVNNNLVSSSDVVVANFNASLASVDQNYRLSLSVGSGAFVITVTNQSGGALAEAVPINFAIIKAVNA